MHCNVMEHFWYEPECSSSYQYVLVHTAITYWYVLYIMTQECFAKQYLHALVHTSMYLYILLYTGMYFT
jgi:hypothetical protein